MNEWRNIRVIPCVDRSGAPLSVIEQALADQRDTAARGGNHVTAMRRYVLGNGDQVKPFDQDRFLLPTTEEIIARR
jgi:hypothetical protein